nr:MAG TPA: hypothetical protein [Caudoviricetes sp.]
MSKQDVIDYVMETPHNTNRAVLESLVDTAVEESQVQVDWNQNDETAKDYIKNRPGGYYIHAPVLGISEDITLHAISATSARFYITFIGEDDDESFDKYDETLILHFFGKEIPISYNTARGYYAVYETLNGITIGVINDNYYDKKTTWSVTYSIEKKSILTPSDFYITKKSSVPFANAIMPQANQNAFGALKPYCYDETDENYPYDDYQQCYQVLSSGEQNGRLTTKKQVRSYYKLTPDIILNSCFYAGEGDFIANFRGTSDEIKNLLGVQDVDFPILMYHKDTVYNSERPTYTLSVITQTGKHGTFTCNRSTKEMTPITWTFEGGGGGNSLFIITPTYNSDTKTWSTDRTWDEVKAAVAKSKNPNDYAMSFNENLLFPDTLSVTKNSGGEITDVYMVMASMNPTILSKNMVPEGFGAAVPIATYATMKYHANSSAIKFEIADSGEILLPIIRTVTITKSNNGTLVCDPPNPVELYGELLGPQNSASAQFICPLYYAGETYHFETGEKDSSNIVSFYFSTTTNSIYKRLKITQGQNGAADTVVMDKEIKLSNVESYRTKQVVVSGTFSNISGVSNDLYIVDRNVFMSLCHGIDSVYLTIGVRREYELTPGGSTNGVYSLMYNGKAAIMLNTRGTSNQLVFSSPFNTEPDGTEFGLYAMQFNDAILPRIPVDNTTIKFNGQGQLTLALSNANGVSF